MYTRYATANVMSVSPKYGPTSGANTEVGRCRLT